MKIIRSALIICLSMLLGNTVFADIQLEQDMDKQNITISGDTEYFNEFASVKVEKEGQFFLLEQFKTNADGQFRCTYPLDIATDSYLIKVHFNKGTTWENTFKFVNSVDQMDLYEKIKTEINKLKALNNIQSSDIESLISLVDDNRDMLPAFNFEEYDEFLKAMQQDMNNVYDIYYYIIKQSDISGLSDFCKQANNALAIKKICLSRDINSLEKYDDCLGLSKKSFYLLFDSMSSDGQMTVMKKLKDMYYSEDDFITGFGRIVLIQALTENNYRNYEDIISKCSECIDENVLTEFNSLDVNNRISVLKIIYDKKIQTYDVFCEEMGKAVEVIKDGIGGKIHGGRPTGSKPTNVVDGVIPTTDFIVDKTIQGFADLHGFEWAKDSIIALKNKGIVNGKTETNFCPADKITREEFLALVLRGFEVSYTNETTSFNDVDPNAWYSRIVSTAKNLGIVNGVGENTFGVGIPITRQEMCVIAHRTAEKFGVVFKTCEEVPFEDDMSEWARVAICDMYASSIVSGVGEKQFMAEYNATRAEASVIIYKLLTYGGII